MKKTILIFYSEFCYDQAAFAIKSYMDKNFPNCDVILVAEKKFVNPFTHWWDKFFYIATIRNLPWINKISYSLKEKNLSKFSDKIELKPNETILKPNQENSDLKAIKTQFRKMENVIMRFDPDLIVCASPTAIKELAKTKKRIELRCPVFAIQNDYAFNSEFVNDVVDGYIVQNEVVAQTMTRKNIIKEKIVTFGTPLLKERVEEQFPREQIRDFLGIENDLPIVSLFGGRFGCDSVRSAFASLICFANRTNIVVMTGGSESLLRYLKTLLKAKGIKENIIFVDKIDKIEKIYSVSDIVVTAPTAYITYETIAREIPNIVIKPLNKVEKQNYSFLTTNGFSLRGATEDELVSSATNLLENETFFLDVKEKLKTVPKDCVMNISKFLAAQIGLNVIVKDDKKQIIDIKKDEDKKDNVFDEQNSGNSKEDIVDTKVKNAKKRKRKEK